MSRRALLGMAALLPLAGCTEDATAGPATPSSTPAPPPAPATDQQLTELERRFGARLGVYALATGSGAVLAHRADESWAFCSTFKAFAAAAVLVRNPLSHLDTRVKYQRGDLMKSAVITSKHVAEGMTIRELCDAGVRYSDGTAGNLLLRDLGGPAELTGYLRGLGDQVTRMDRMEPNIVTAVPGDPRDTSSPRALGTSFQRIVLGDALPPDKRAVLTDLLKRNATSAGAHRIRAGVPAGWTVADKTGTGDYGTLNDLAVLWPPNSAPLLVAIMSSKPEPDAEYDEKLLAEAATHVVRTLTPA